MTLADNAGVFRKLVLHVSVGIVNESGASLSYAGSASKSETTVSIPLDNFGSVSVTKEHSILTWIDHRIIFGRHGQLCGEWSAKSFASVEIESGEGGELLGCWSSVY